jgi:hypothetical protein
VILGRGLSLWLTATFQSAAMPAARLWRRVVGFTGPWDLSVLVVEAGLPCQPGASARRPLRAVVMWATFYVTGAVQRLSSAKAQS